MVFLFPGVLFRKFYFSGKFGNQFDQGNLLERLLISIFFSFMCLIFTYLSFSSLDVFFGLKPLDDINFKTISGVFKTLSENKYPDEFTDETKFKSFVYILITIYVLAGLVGLLTKNIVRIFSLDSISVLKFRNNWHYLSEAYKENAVSRKIGDQHTTFVDVLLKSDDKDVLYTGILNNFILNSDDRLENIVLSNAYKFLSVSDKEKIKAIELSIKEKENIYIKHKEYEDRVIYKKSIDGNLLVLSNDKILNINFTYVKTSNKINTYKRYFFKFIYVLYIVAFFGLIILPFIQFEVYFLNTILKKITFSITVVSLMTYLINLLSRLLKIRTFKTKLKFVDFIFLTAFMSSPLLYVFNISSSGWTFFLALLILFIYAGISNRE